MLGGKVLTELKESGAKHKTFVYAGSEVLATQEIITSQGVTWEHRDPSDASYRTTQITGDIFDYRELDPTGADVTAPPILNEPNVPDDGTGSLLPYPSFSNPTCPGTSYSVDGIPVSTDYFMRVMDNNYHGSFSGSSLRGEMASAPRFAGYTVSTYNGRLNRFFGSNFQRAGNEAIEQGHYTIVRNWIVSDTNSASLFSLIPNQPSPQNPGQQLPGPKPAPAPKPTPNPPDPCRDRSWKTILKDWREISDWIGWQLKDSGDPGKDVAQNTFEQIEKLLAKHDFKPFPWHKPNLNPQHGSGYHYEGLLRPKQWYHVVVHPAQDYPLIIPGNFRSRPASTIEIHCEEGFKRPSSLSHAWDFIF